MLRSTALSASALALIFALVACGGGGGGGGGVTPHGTPTPGATSTPAGPGTTATVTFTTWSGQPLPTTVAYETNGGTWKAGALAGATMTLPLPAGTTSYGFGFACPSFSSSIEQGFVELSVHDTTAVTGIGCQGSYSQPSVSVPYNFTAIPGSTGGTVQISSGASNNLSSVTSTSGTTSLSFGPATSDVMEVATNAIGSTVGMHVLRSQTLTPSGTLTFPAMAASDETTAAQTITTAGTGYTGLTASVQYQTAEGGTFQIAADNNGVSVPQIAAAQAVAGDTYVLATSGTLTSTGDTGGTGVVTTTPTSQTITAPPVWSFAGPTASDTPTFNLSYSGFNLTGYGYDEVGDVTNSSITVFIESTTLAGTNPTLSIPNIVGLGTFVKPTLSGTNEWVAILAQTNGTTAILPGQNLTTGEYQTQRISGTFTAP